MKKAILRVSGMTCPSCLATLQGALGKQEGVGDVNVLFNAGKIKANFEPDVTSAQALADVVTSLGYPVEKITEKEIAA